MTARGDAPRLLISGGVVAALVIAALSWFVVVSPLRSGTQTLRDDTAAVEIQNVAIEAKMVSLRQQLEDRDQLVENARQALSGLPPGAQLPGFNRQLARQARAHGVDLTSITVGASTSSALAGGTADPTTPSTGTLTIPVTIQTTGTVAQQLLFLHDLQQVGPRRALLTSTSLAPGQVGSSIETSSTMTVQLTVFAAPLADAVRTQLAGVLRPGRSS